VNVGRMTTVCFGLFLAATLGLSTLVDSHSGVPQHRSTAAITVCFAVWVASFIYAMYLSIAVMRYGDRGLVKRGVRGTARVLSSKETSWAIAAGEYYGIGAPKLWKYRLEVTVPGKRSYKTTLYICAHLGTGETVPVFVSRLNPQRVTVDLETHARARVSADGAQSAANVRLEDLAARWQRLGGTLVTSVRPTPDVAEELSKLVDLRDRGVLSDVEFQTQKAKVLATS